MLHCVARGITALACLVPLGLPCGLSSTHAAPPPPPAPPAAPPPDAIALPALLAFAELHAPTLALDLAIPTRVRAARAAAGPGVPANPELALAVGPRLTGGAAGVDFEVTLSQRLEVGGERAARLRTAAATEARLAAESRDRHWDVHTTLHALFFTALVARERVSLARRVLAFQEDIAAIVAKRRHAGQDSRLAEDVARAEAATARQRLAAAEQDELAVRHELALVSGWPSEAPPLPLGTLDDAPPLASITELSTLAHAERPDIALWLALEKEARARVAAAERDATPEPTLGLGWTRESAPGGGEATHVIVAFASVPLPFTTPNQGDIADAHAQLATVRAELAQAEARVMAEVTRAHHAARAAAARLDAYGQDVLPRFEENLAALRKAYELGEIDILGLASGRERFMAAQEDALRAREDFFNALAQLEHAVGVDIIDDGDQ